MATVVLTLTNICVGGGHFTIVPVVNGNAKPARVFDRASIVDAMTEEEINITIAGLLKLYSIGKTNLQIKNGLEAGATVTVG